MPEAHSSFIEHIFKIVFKISFKATKVNDPAPWPLLIFKSLIWNFLTTVRRIDVTDASLREECFALQLIKEYCDPKTVWSQFIFEI